MTNTAEDDILLEELAQYVEEVAIELKSTPCTISYNKETQDIEIEMSRDHDMLIGTYQYIESGILDKLAVRKAIYEEVLNFLEEETSIYPEELEKYSDIMNTARKLLD